MKIRCRLCESTLNMKDDGSGAVCPVCGMYYSMDVLRQMFQKANGGLAGSSTPEAPTVQPAKLAEPVRTAETLKPVEPVRTAEPVKPVEPVRAAEPVRSPEQASQKKHAQGALEPEEPAQKQSALDSEYVQRMPQIPRPKHAMNNESFGLDPSQYVQFDSLRSPAYVAAPQPKAPGLFASAAAKHLYEEQMAAWRRTEAVRLQQMRQYNQILNSQQNYWRKFYEQTNPVYSLEEDWKPYFEAILTEEFPEYKVYKEVSCRDLFGEGWKSAKISFLMVKENRPVLALILSDQRLMNGEPGNKNMPYKYCIRHGLPALMFFTRLSNRRAYVIQRIRKALNS